MENWYKVISPDENISQGDILFNCPIFVPDYPGEELSINDFETLEGREIPTDVKRANVIVLNQACDLEVREGKDAPKIDTVLVAVLKNAREAGSGRKALAKVAKLEKTQYFLLNPSLQGIYMDHQVVHFDVLVSFPWKLINSFSKIAHGPRLRLWSPYLEQMSQHFGNHFGRVALPGNREEEISKYYTLMDEYEAKRLQGEVEKMWNELTPEEVATYINENHQQNE
jgi:hypothetical protein